MKHCRVLEEKVAELTNRKYAIAVNNGTDALYFSLVGLNIGKGDEVLVTNFSWISTASCISMVGATPVFCDVDLNTYHMSMSSIRKMCSSKTKAIIYPHLFGSMSDTKELVTFCNNHNILLIEDACQSFGCFLNVPAGSIGDISTLSFNLNKVVSGVTGGGMVLTDDKDVYDLVSKIRKHGEGVDFEFLGKNSKMSKLDADTIYDKISTMEDTRVIRESRAKKYNQFFSEFKLQESPKELIHNHHKYTIRFNNKETRDFVQKIFDLKVHYPKPISENSMYNTIYHRKDNCINAKEICDTIVTLPLEFDKKSYVEDIYLYFVEKIFASPDWAKSEVLPKKEVKNKFKTALCNFLYEL